MRMALRDILDMIFSVIKTAEPVDILDILVLSYVVYLGMKLVREGGYLITCSCSQHVTPPLFREMLLDAQKDARVKLRQVEWRTQGRDHPILLSSPETEYLKCAIFQVLS